MILIVSPRHDQPGGVANFYRMLFPYLIKNNITFFYLAKANSRASRTIQALFKYFEFCSKIHKHKELECIVLNPSLGITSFLRDGLFCFIATSLFRKRTAVFWHGWSNDFSKTISKSFFLKCYFRHTFGKSSLMFVLSPCFKDILLEWGFPGKINITTTCFEDSILQYSEQNKTNTSNRFQFLFLSRIEPDKGAEIVLDSFSLLQKKYDNIFQLVIAGDGSSRAKLIRKAEELDVQNVSFPGNVVGQQKLDVLYSSNVFCFPSSHGEGMPCALLEAMGAGLTLITTNAGGFQYIFQAPDMGYMTQDLSVDNFCRLMEASYLDHRDPHSRNQFNQQYAKRFSASNVSMNLISSLREA